jgi:hypothetical protein
MTSRRSSGANGRAPDGSDDPGADDDDFADVDDPTVDRPEPRRTPWRMLTDRVRPVDAASDDDGPVEPARDRSAADPVDDLELKPTAMRKPEPLYGYVVAAELIVVSILNLTVTHGKGAPAHPQTVLALAGLAASIALVGLIRTHHRLIAAFGAVMAAFVATLPRVPSSMAISHLLALTLPLIYAFVLTQHQRKAATAQAAARGEKPGRSRGRAAKTEPAGRRQSRRDRAAPSGPKASPRYTPPKSKRLSR